MKILSALAALLLFGLAAAREFRLDDGTILHGEIVSRNDSAVVIRNPTLGKITVAASRIVEGLDPEDSSATPVRRARDTDPAGYALYMLPTAFMPPAKAFTFRDFELVFLTFGYSPTSTTALTAGTFFPITGHFGVLTLGGKQQLFQFDGTAAAVTASFTLPLEGADGVLINTNAVISQRFALAGYRDALGIHGVVGYLAVKGDGGGEGQGVFGFGAEARISSHVKFIGEYVGLQEFSQDGLLNIGIRLHGERLSADIVGMRPVEADGSDLLFIPLVIVNYRF
jgi:hypothetical protein